MADSTEMQKTRYIAKKHGLKVVKINGGDYLILDKKNNCLAENFGTAPKSLDCVKNFLVELEINDLKKSVQID